MLAPRRREWKPGRKHSLEIESGVERRSKAGRERESERVCSTRSFLTIRDARETRSPRPVSAFIIVKLARPFSRLPGCPVFNLEPLLRNGTMYGILSRGLYCHEYREATALVERGKYLFATRRISPRFQVSRTRISFRG